MCGIAGIISFQEQNKLTGAIIEMTKSLKLRGPDDEGYMLFSNTCEAFYGEDSIQKNTQNIHAKLSTTSKLGLGFRQLKIMDLSSQSHQPMTDVSKRFWIVFNGEIYNFKEIRPQLEALGHRFFSESDTEVVLNSYKEWGKDALQKFNGMFAFAIYDSVKNELFIARDRVGIKPLYFYKNDQYFIFGSTVNAIIKSKLYTPIINWEGLWQNFRFTTAQRPNTVYQDVFSLDSAHYMIVNLNNNAVSKHQYWEIPIQTQDFSLSEKQCKNRVEESLFNAVNYRLISNVNVGSFMSGGIDSSLISVFASKKEPTIKTLTLGFKEFKNFDEVPQASKTAEFHQLNHVVSYGESADAFKDLQQACFAYEEPYFHLSANLTLAKMASENNIKVVLSGLGGDELFGGYDVYNKISLWEKLQKNKNIVSLLPGIHPKIKKGKELANYVTLGEFYSHYYTHFYDKEISNLFLNTSYNTNSVMDNLYNKERVFTDAFEAMSFFNLKSYIGNHQMRALDGTMMTHSIEGRFPMLDHNFIEMAFKIPTKFKLKNKVQKHILKEAAKDYLPKEVIEMPKKGLSLPLKSWIKTDLKEVVLDSFNQLKKRHIFDEKELNNIQKSKNETKIWQLVATEIWLQNFIDT